MSEQQYQLIVQKGPQPGKVYLLMTDSITIGRDPMADISLNDPEVSRQHVQLTQTTSGYVLEDLGSTNGTFIDGEKLAPETPISLESGQTVSMGSGVTLLYETVKPEPEPEPEPVVEPIDELYDPFSPPIPESAEEALVPAFEDPPELPEFSDPPAAPSQPPQPAAPVETPPTPLVPNGDSEQQKRRRRMITIAVTIIVLLCCCCLLFMLSAYFYWGDPLMESMGIY